MCYAAIAALCLILLDIVTGIVGAVREKSLSSTKMRDGLFNKAGLVLVLILAFACDHFVSHVPELGLDVPVFIPACCLVFLMEVMSVVENIGKIAPALQGSRLLGLFKGKEG